MKKILAVALLALAGTVGAQAQSGNRHYRAEVGVGASNLDMSNSFSTDARFATRLGGAVEFVLAGGQSGEFYLAPGLEYRFSSYKFRDAFSTHRLAIPVSAGYRFLFSNGQAVSLEGGLFAAYGIAGSKDVYKSGVDYLDLKRFEVGLQGSVAYEFGRYSVRLGANYGLTDVNSLSFMKVHSADFFASFGIRF